MSEPSEKELMLARAAMLILIQTIGLLVKTFTEIKSAKDLYVASVAIYYGVIQTRKKLDVETAEPAD